MDWVGFVISFISNTKLLFFWSEKKDFERKISRFNSLCPVGRSDVSFCFFSFYLEIFFLVEQNCYIIIHALMIVVLWVSKQTNFEICAIVIQLLFFCLNLASCPSNFWAKLRHYYFIRSLHSQCKCIDYLLISKKSKCVWFSNSLPVTEIFVLSAHFLLVFFVLITILGVGNKQQWKKTDKLFAFYVFPSHIVCVCVCLCVSFRLWQFYFLGFH